MWGRHCEISSMTMYKRASSRDNNINMVDIEENSGTGLSLTIYIVFIQTCKDLSCTIVELICTLLLPNETVPCLNLDLFSQ